MGWPLWAVVLAAFPVALLAVLVLRDQPVTRTAWLAAGVAAVIAMAAFGLDLVEVLVSLLRGLWTGSWILLIVLPALLLYEILDRSGALDHLAEAADQLAPTEGRRLLLLAFVLPSFLQGAAGFGAPIAMSAPMLVRRGMAPAAAVAACLIGYQWSVTFGSMGSSYFMAEATARLDPSDARSFALRAGLVLAISAVVSGLLVLTRGERSPGDRWRALLIGVVMGAVLVGIVTVQPAIGSTAAGLAGLVACWLVLPGRGGSRPGGSDLVVAASPYAVLTVTAVIGFAVQPVRAVFDRVPALAPVLPGVEAAFGFATPESSVTPVFRPLLHPLPYLLLAIAVAVLGYRRRGWWPSGRTQEAITGWVPRARKVAASILGLTVLAAVLTEAGMVAAMAAALADSLGIGFLLVSAPLGSLGTILTGSTTASNALFSSLQAEVAVALGLLPALLLSGQTAGGNIGNTLAPAPIAVGTASAGAVGQEGAVLRRNLVGASVLTAAVLVTLVVQYWLLRTTAA
jgi:lactate permease